MQSQLLLDEQQRLYAEREAIARVYDFYWNRIQDFEGIDCTFEKERLLVLEAEHIKAHKRLEAFEANEAYRARYQITCVRISTE